VFNLTKFSSLEFILYSPKSQITNPPQRALQSVHIRHLAGPHIGSGNTPQKVEKTLSRGKKGRKPSGEQQRRIPLPGWTETIDVVCTDEQRYRVS